MAPLQPRSTLSVITNTTTTTTTRIFHFHPNAPPSLLRAHAWYSAAALEGNADSLQCLVDMTRRGRGVSASEAQALQLLAAANELRSAAAE
jgi:hypothetical protein